MQTRGDKSLSVRARRNEVPCSPPKNRKLLRWEKEQAGSPRGSPQCQCDAILAVPYFSLSKLKMIQSPDRDLTRTSGLESSAYAPLRYDKHHSNPTFCSLHVEILNLWKSCVLSHFLLYLRYISDASQVQTLQATLNRSLSTTLRDDVVYWETNRKINNDLQCTTLHVYGHPTAPLADTGIPPLYITQNLQLAQFRFRLHSSPLDTIQHFLWQLWQPLLQVVPLDTFEYRMQTAICHVDLARRDPASPLPSNISLAYPLAKRNYTRNTLSLDALINGKSTSSLHSIVHQDECEHTYTGIFTTNTDAACIDQPHISFINFALTN